MIMHSKHQLVEGSFQVAHLYDKLDLFSLCERTYGGRQKDRS